MKMIRIPLSSFEKNKGFWVGLLGKINKKYPLQ